MNIHLRFSKHFWQYPILVTLHEKARSSRPEAFCKKGIFENFANQRCFHGISEIFKNTFFNRAPTVTASEKIKAEAVVQICSVKNVFLESSQNSQENTCTRVSFLQSWACNFIKIESLTQVFSCEFCKHLSKNTFFRGTFGGCFCKSLQFYQNKTWLGVLFANFLKIFGTFFWCAARFF